MQYCMLVALSPPFAIGLIFTSCVASSLIREKIVTQLDFLGILPWLNDFPSELGKCPGNFLHVNRSQLCVFTLLLGT